MYDVPNSSLDGAQMLLTVQGWPACCPALEELHPRGKEEGSYQVLVSGAQLPGMHHKHA